MGTDRGMGLMGMLRKDGSTIFYQIQHRCDLTLGQGYLTSHKSEMHSQVHPFRLLRCFSFNMN
jgi:hypothetical protein